MRIIAFSNQKGGVAKTTSSYAMAVGLAKRGYQVLVVDADPQENLSMTAGIDLNEVDPDPEDIEALTPEQRSYFEENVPAKLFEVMAGDKDINKAIIPIAENLDLIVGGIDLASADMTFSMLGREKLIKEAFKKIKKEYDFCIFDCSPALGVVLMNILTVADEVIIPLEPGAFSLQGLSRLYKFIGQIHDFTNDKLKVDGILVTKVRNTANAKIWINDIEEKADLLGTTVYKSKIRLNVSVEEAQTMKMDLFEYAGGSSAARDYDDFIDEFLGED
ncbi:MULTISPECIES: ParA family protein [unclassified Butyrivibrio]|jgi:chromosome partitioning protein|uniref:ParA family protein n=1 Tax=unclassified Butyrivibrio TaxID=2639466 RepID=UPI0003B3C089|nr:MULTISPECIES: AAA family ATPase [unclassified Butyrivibrio]MBE5837675.1 ParA family protein [Butyrivibrio sp.]MBQ9302635.1 ParA family protein [Butyrivibrio sp.]SEF87554.1 chromosome partitioning protein [Butyrivibrio sp. Su6]